MSNSLQFTISDLATQFAEQLLNQIRGLSLQEILALSNGSASAPAKRGPGRPPKKLAANGSKAAASKPRASSNGGAGGVASVEQVVAVLKKYPGGLRSEHLRSELGLQRVETQRVVAAALSAKKISKKGERRATTYFAR